MTTTVYARGSEVGARTVLDVFALEAGEALAEELHPITGAPRGQLVGTLSAPTGSPEEFAILELLAQSSGVHWQGPAQKRRARAGEEAA